MKHQMSFRGLTTVVLLLAVVTGPSWSSAGERHLRLTDSFPAEEARLEEPPTEIRLWFSETPELAISRIALTGPGGEVALGDVEAGDEDSLMAVLEEALAPGDYEVAWRTSSADGHPIRGTFGFSLAAANR